MSEVCSQSYWDNSYKDCRLGIAPKTDLVRHWIEKFISKGTGDCLEIGCFPGRYLAVFGEMGYRLHGIDLTPRVENDLPTWLAENGFGVGQFQRRDFMKEFTTEKRYDIVCSFGFIEHFVNWQEVLIKQASLVKKGGYLVVAVPNFKGTLQRMLHVLLDKRNYDRHYIPAMQPHLWKDIIQNLDFEPVYCGYFGVFDFWVDVQKRNIFQKVLLNVVNYLLPLLKIFPEGNKFYAPYCGLIAKKL